MTVMSMPAWRSWTAQLWRRTWGVGFLAVMEGQVLAAVVACRVRMRLMASRLSGPPRGLGKRGSFGWPGHSFIQARRTLAVSVVSGVARCFRPLPVQVRCAPVPSTVSVRRRPVSSETGLDLQWNRNAR